MQDGKKYSLRRDMYTTGMRRIYFFIRPIPRGIRRVHPSGPCTPRKIGWEEPW